MLRVSLHCAVADFLFQARAVLTKGRSHRRYFTHRLDAQLPFDFMQYMELSMVHPIF